MIDSAPYSPVAVGQRIEKLRIALNLGSQSALAGRLGVERGRYFNWEAGTILLPVPYAAQLRSFTGATLDYIYLGETSALPLSLNEALAKLSPSSS